MPKSAITDLQQQIETVRREAFAAGYAAAMEAVRELASQSSPQADAPAAEPSRRRRGRSRGRTRTQQAKPASAKPRRSRQTSTRGRTSTVTRTTGRAAATRPGRSARRRSQRGGTNALMIEEILKAAAPNTLRPAEIRKALQDKGVTISFASIRHALGQLERRNAAEQPENKTWRATGDAPETRSALVADAGPTD
jgi:hypothetical protein